MSHLPRLCPFQGQVTPNTIAKERSQPWHCQQPDIYQPLLSLIPTTRIRWRGGGGVPQASGRLPPRQGGQTWCSSPLY